MGASNFHVVAMRERVYDALKFISPDCSRDEWATIAMAIKSEFGADGFELFDTWSQGGSTYTPAAARDTYRSVAAIGGIGIGSLIYAAKKNGYQPSSPGLSRQAVTVPAPRLAPLPAETAGSAAQLQNNRTIQELGARQDHQYYLDWPDATSRNTYLNHKGLAPVPGLKEAPNGKLVVPVSDATGTITSLQFIGPNGEKAFKRGGRIKGGYFIVGGVPGKDLHIAEGLATAMSLYLASGTPCVVAFSKDNLHAVCQTMREQYPAACITVCADNDRYSKNNGGVEKATEAARATGALLAIPAFKQDGGTDFDDLRRQEGIEVVRQQLATAFAAPPVSELACDLPLPQKVQRYKVRRASDLSASAPMRWLIHGVLPAEGLAALFGPSGSGKSFLALDIAVAVSDGRVNWFGRRVFQAPVTYIMLEGEQGLGKRVRAMVTHCGDTAPENLRVISQPLKLNSNDDVNALAAALKDAGCSDGMVIIDTLNRAAVGLDENSSSHMGEIIAGAKLLQALVGGLVLLVHHTGKEQSRGLRGHSSLHAALDAAIEVDRSDGRRLWRVAKSKDDEDGQSFPFALEVVQLDSDEHGCPVSSCVVVADNSQRSTVKARGPSGKRQQVVYAAICDALPEGRLGVEGAPQDVRCIRFSDAVRIVAPALTCADDRRTNVAREVIDGLISNGFIILYGDWLTRGT